jgi:hypothetical protein
MSITPLKNLILASSVIGFSMVVLATGQFDTTVARAASGFAAGQVDSGAQAYVANDPHGMWSFEFD